MKRLSTWLLVLLTMVATLGLSACGAAAVQSNSTVLSSIYTSVVITVEAQATAATPTASLLPTSTSLPTSTPVWSLSPSATATTYSSAYSYANGCEDAAYEGDVTIEDGTEIAPGESFSKIWSMKNTGSCTWSKNFYVTFVSGNDMDGSDTKIDTVVDPGEVASVAVDLTAPEDEGAYVGYWRMADSSGNTFGEKVYVQIVVSDSVATSTPTSTPSPTATSTAAVNTSTPTAAVDTPTPTLVQDTPASTTVVDPLAATEDEDAPTPTSALDPATPTATACVSSPTPTEIENIHTPTPTTVSEMPARRLARITTGSPTWTSTSKPT